MYHIIQRLEHLENKESAEFQEFKYRGSGTEYMGESTKFIMDKIFENGPNNPTVVQRVNEKAFEILSGVENTTQLNALPSIIIQIEDITLYTLGIYHIGEKMKSTYDDHVKSYGPLICLATLQISTRGKRVILYSLSCQHKNTAHGIERIHYKLSDEEAKGVISRKLSEPNFRTELVQKARTKPANDIAIGFDDSQKY